MFTPRPELDRTIEYKPGLSVDEIKRRYGIKEIIKLASNENPLGTSTSALSAYKKAMKHIFRYPESKSIDLRRVIADRYKLGIENVIVGNGSDEIIELLAKAYLTPHDEIIISKSTFLEYEIAANLMGAHVKRVEMVDMKCDLSGILKKVSDKTKLIFIANPNNPTGTYANRDEMKFFLSKLPAHVLPIIDEAYYDYALSTGDYPSVIREFFTDRPVMVLRTFSKAFGLAGIRVGYGAGPEDVIRNLDKIRPPFNVSIPAQFVALAALGDDAFIQKTVQLNDQGKEFLMGEFEKLGLEATPTAGNFILFSVKPLKGRAIFEKLLRKGIIVRSVDEYTLPNHLRVTIGTTYENKKFLKALKEVLQEK